MLKLSKHFLTLRFFFPWRIIALQCCGGLCHTLTWISHNCVCVCVCVCVLSLLSLRLPDIPPFSVITECQARLPVLYSGFPLGNVLHMIVHNICQCSFFNLSYPLLPPLCLPVLPVHLHLLFFSVNRIISTMFLDSISAQISFQKCILSALMSFAPCACSGVYKR